MDYLAQSFSVRFEYRVYFTTGIFEADNESLSSFLKERSVPEAVQKILFVIDQGVSDKHPRLQQGISQYFKRHPGVEVVKELLIIPGGEEAKNNPAYFDQITKAVHLHGIDRHSYIIAVGGGSVLDLAGYAASVSHRGINLIRIPTTVLSQNDSGIGVKNGINQFGKKNFLGTFSPPVAVFNDDRFLSSLDQRNWRSGIAEAVKVALIKDAAFFAWIEKHTEDLVNRDQETMNYLIRHCADLHLKHIGGADPFEKGSSRPLDFGHWSAHKLEQLTHFEVLHGEAVAMGIALDTLYSSLAGYLSPEKADRVLRVLINLGFEITHPLMQIKDQHSPVLSGLQEFREHLGGRLTIMLMTEIGVGKEVFEIDTALLIRAGKELSSYSTRQTMHHL
ncbi:MAG: 3-dehydroquinate synthase [Bacteroidota bacterium]|nr:3-dehydroquinate synthase [Bacteroidota bacterium]MDP4248948.1 3-dehydroquinate synthase [Bacteroidota bacterium]